MPAQQKQRVPISWQQWQGPSKRDASAAADRRGQGTAESTSRRRVWHDAAENGARDSHRDGRPHSPERSRRSESRSGREGLLTREAAAIRVASAERAGTATRRDAGTERRGRESGERSPDREREAGLSRSRSRDRRRPSQDPRIGPSGPKELEETIEEAELRRCGQTLENHAFRCPPESPVPPYGSE